MTLFGLPLHPLVVHAAVVLLPLAALGAIVIAVSERARMRYCWLVVAGAFAAGGSVVAARVTGEAFAGGTTGTGALATHMTWGMLAPWPATALAVTTLLLMLTSRSTNRPLKVTLGTLTIVAALAGLAVIVVVGHSGATSVWGA